MENYFKRKIVSELDAGRFFNNLYKDSLLFHPEDDPSDIIEFNEDTGEYEQLFDTKNIEILRIRLDEVYEVMEDPCKYIIEEIYNKN